MKVVVNTKHELKEAIKRKSKSIIIADENLGNKIKTLKPAKKMTKWTIGCLLAGSGACTIGLALVPITGGVSAGAGGMFFGLSTAAAGGGISVPVAIAIGSLAICGSAVIFAIWKDYDVRIAELGPVKGIELFRK